MPVKKRKSSPIVSKDPDCLQKELIQACDIGDASIIQTLIFSGASVNRCVQIEGLFRTNVQIPLHIAVQNGNLGIVKILIENEADVNSRDALGNTPLSLAAKNDNDEMMKVLIQNGASVNNRNRDGDTPLSIAAKYGKVEAMGVLIENGADVSNRSKDENTPLNLAAMEGKKEAIKVLIKNGADVNERSKDGNTPLSIAAEYGEKEAMKVLIVNGADVNNTSNDGNTPLSIAAEYGQKEAMKILIENGANVNNRSNDGNTPLGLAAEYGQIEAMKVLIKDGADVNNRSNDGDTPLHKALIFGKEEAKVKIKDIDGETFRRSDLLGRTENMIELLIENGAKVNIKNRDGDTPLSSAVQLGERDWIKLLIENGADVNIKNEKDQTVKDLAKGGTKAVLQQLNSDFKETSTTMPKEIKQLGREAVKLYLRAQAKGSFTSNLIRCMFVGHYGAGKTTLVAHLLGVKRIKTSSTNSIDVYLGKCYYNEKKNDWDVQDTHTQTLSGEEGIIQIDIWDFAGQLIFYTTHQTYLSRRGLYFLVFNLALGLHDEVQDEDLDPLQNNRRKIIDFLEFWIGSIRVYANSDHKGFPRIILVGTHKDKVIVSANIREIKDEISTKFRQMLESGELILREDLFLNALDMSEQTISLLRDVILTEGQKYPEYGEEIPSSWMELHKTIFREKQGEEEIISLERIKEYNREMQSPLGENELKVFLLYLHELGYIVYFDVDTLRDFVILTPRWTIDALKCIITCPMFALSALDKQAWEQMRLSGKVHQHHIENVWKKRGNTLFYQHRQHLLLTMEKLDLICRPKVYDRNGNDVESEHFYIPCMLDSSRQLEGEAFQANEGSVELSFIFQDILPPAVFNRLLSACITLWQIHDEHLYHALAVFRCGSFHFLSFRRQFKRITVNIHHLKSNDEIDRNLCMAVDTFVSQTIDGILSTFCTSTEECKPYSTEYNEVARLLYLHNQDQEENTDFDDTVCSQECKGLDKTEAEMEIKECQLMRIGKLWRRKGLTLLSTDLLGDVMFLDDIREDYADLNSSDLCFIMLHEWKRRLEASGKRVTAGDLEMTCTDIGYDTHDLCKILRCKNYPVSFLSPAFQMKEVSAELLDALSDRISTTYLELGLELGLDFEEIKQCRMNNRNSTKKIVMEMLRVWKERNKSEATVLKLATALVGTQSNITSLIEAEDRGIHLAQEVEVSKSKRCHIQLCSR